MASDRTPTSSLLQPPCRSPTNTQRNRATRWSRVSRSVLLNSGRERYVEHDAIAEAFVKLPLDDLPARPTIADYRAAATLARAVAHVERPA